jgi:hypothetical protein
MKRIVAMLASAALLIAAEETVAPLGSYTAAERRQWEFQPRKDPAPPALSGAADKAWVQTPVDAFILAGLQKAGLKPAPRADRATLIRRITFDLYGATDGIGLKAVEKPVHFRDLHATLLYQMGLDQDALNYMYLGRKERLTEVRGEIVKEIVG